MLFSGSSSISSILINLLLYQLISPSCLIITIGNGILNTACFVNESMVSSIFSKFFCLSVVWSSKFCKNLMWSETKMTSAIKPMMMFSIMSIMTRTSSKITSIKFSLTYASIFLNILRTPYPCSSINKAEYNIHEKHNSYKKY